MTSKRKKLPDWLKHVLDVMKINAARQRLRERRREQFLCILKEENHTNFFKRSFETVSYLLNVFCFNFNP